MKNLNANRIITLLLYVETLAVFAYYKPGLGDTDLIIQGGNRLLNGINPYVGFDFGNSPVAGAVFHLLGLLPIQLVALAIPLINTTGYVFLAKFISETLSIRFSVWLLVVPLLSPFRALISAGQVSGLVILLSLLSFMGSSRTLPMKSLQVISAVLAIEIKPQLALPIIFASIAINRNYVKLASIGFSIFLAHAGLALYLGKYLEVEWIKSLMLRSKFSLAPESFQVSGWKFINFLAGNENLWRVVSTCLYLGTFLYILKLRNKAEYAYVIAFISSLFLTYQHLYDLIPLIIIFLSHRNKNDYLRFFMITILLIKLPVTAFSLLAFIPYFIFSMYRYFKFGESLLYIPLPPLLILPEFLLQGESLEIQYSFVSTIFLVAGMYLLYKPKVQIRNSS